VNPIFLSSVEILTTHIAHQNDLCKDFLLCSLLHCWSKLSLKQILKFSLPLSTMRRWYHNDKK